MRASDEIDKDYCLLLLLQSPPSAAESETHLTHHPRVWTARDACVDTSELRCHLGPKPCVLTLCQPPSAPFSYLTTLHFEKVSIPDDLVHSYTLCCLLKLPRGSLGSTERPYTSLGLPT